MEVASNEIWFKIAFSFMGGAVVIITALAAWIFVTFKENTENKFEKFDDKFSELGKELNTKFDKLCEILNIAFEKLDSRHNLLGDRLGTRIEQCEKDANCMSKKLLEYQLAAQSTFMTKEDCKDKMKNGKGAQ